MTVFARDRAKCGPEQPRRRVIVGDLQDGAALADAMRGQDAVISAIGRGYSFKSEHLIERTVPGMIAAMRAAGVRRLLFTSALGVGQSVADSPLMARLFFRTLLRGIYADKLIGDQLIRTQRSRLDHRAAVADDRRPADAHLSIGGTPRVVGHAADLARRCRALPLERGRRHGDDRQDPAGVELKRRDALWSVAAGSIGLAATRLAAAAQPPELLIRRGRVVNADGAARCRRRIVGETIAEVGPNLRPSANARIIEAAGRLVLPGGIDPHTHLHPSFVDDLTSGSMAALAGGITTVGTFANATAKETLLDAIDRMAARVRTEAIADVILHASAWPPSPEIGGGDEGARRDRPAQLQDLSDPPGCRRAQWPI